MDEDADPMGSQPYGTPSPFEKDVIKNISKTLPQYLSASGRTPLQDLDGIITPNGLFTSWRRSHHRSGAAPADASWPR
jgi:sulfane dehydrogenase subunit SoxC